VVNSSHRVSRSGWVVGVGVMDACGEERKHKHPKEDQTEQMTTEGKKSEMRWEQKAKRAVGRRVLGGSAAISRGTWWGRGAVQGGRSNWARLSHG
jgi:hypothetical protein